MIESIRSMQRCVLFSASQMIVVKCISLFSRTNEEKRTREKRTEKNFHITRGKWQIEKDEEEKGAENKEVHRDERASECESAFVFNPKGYPVNIKIDRHKRKNSSRSS